MALRTLLWCGKQVLPKVAIEYDATVGGDCSPLVPHCPTYSRAGYSASPDTKHPASCDAQMFRLRRKFVGGDLAKAR